MDRRVFGEQIRRDYEEQLARKKRIEEQRNALEKEKEKNERKLLLCIWILFALYGLLFLIQSKLYIYVPTAFQQTQLEIIRYAKWIICIGAIVLYAWKQHDDAA